MNLEIATAWNDQVFPVTAPQCVRADQVLAYLQEAGELPIFDAEGERLSYRWRTGDGRPLDTHALLAESMRLVLSVQLTAAASPARMRRLLADFELVKNEFTGHQVVRIEPYGGYPPERYRITYYLRGIEALDGYGYPVWRDTHVAEIYLHSSYPREKPLCTLLTPIFHPNFGSFICVADYWGAGQTLTDLIIHIGQMIGYQNYNPKSPLDGYAAQWVRENEHLFPTDARDLYPAEPEITLGGKADDDGEKPVVLEVVPVDEDEDEDEDKAGGLHGPQGDV